MKKTLKIIGILVGVIVLLLFLAPYLFKDSLEDLLKKNLHKNLNATVSWEGLDLTLLGSFPDAALVLKNFSVINKAPFEGDTLASGAQIRLKMGITQLFKSNNDAIKIDALQIDRAQVHIKKDSLGRANYDISIKSESNNEGDSQENTGFTFDLDHYELNDSKFNYHDEISQTFLRFDNLTHKGTGDFSSDISELSTQTKAQVSFKLGDIEYLSQNIISLDADFKLDLKNQKYTFLENEAKVNELPLTFDGFVQVNETNTEIDLDFTTPSSDFKNFLAVIPKVYAKNLDGVTTTGDFSVNGSLKGVASDTHIPKMDIQIKSTNASFKYPNLPKTVKNISLDAALKNETGLAKDTYVQLGGISFKIDEELFTANGSIKHITTNALINLALKGTLDLAKIDQVWPLDLEQDLSGVFKADVTTNFDMNSVGIGAYQNIKTMGTAQLQRFAYSDPAFQNEIIINDAQISMKPGNIRLDALDAQSGATDITATGSIQNLIPWVMAKQDLKGRFNVQSNKFKVSDFMAAETASSSTTTSGEASVESVKIPDFLDATLDFNAKEVIYDNIVLKNAKGTVGIKDETANLSNVTSEIFGGEVAFSGNVNTQADVPTFAMELDLQEVDIESSFGALALLRYLAPIAKALDGNLNSKLSLQGSLNDLLIPDLKTLVGNAIARVNTTEINPSQTPLLSKLGEEMAFLQLDKFTVQDISTALDFKDGRIIIQPFDVTIKDIAITAQGSHGLDKSMDYSLTMDVPAKYLGSDVTNLLSKLDPSDANNMKVALPVGVSGSMLQPKISVNTGQAVKTLTAELIKKQKESLTNKGTDILKDILTGGGSATNTPKDSTNTSNSGNTPQDQTTKVVKDILGGLFGQKKKKKDSTGN